MPHHYRAENGGKTVIRTHDTVVRSTGTVIMKNKAIVRSSGTVVKFNREQECDQSTVDAISRVTWVGVGVNIALAALKLFGGLIGKSQALIADAAHSISDLATDAAVLIGVRYWSMPADDKHPLGHAKLETLVTLAIGVTLATIGIGLGYQAVSGVARVLADPAIPRFEQTGMMQIAAWVGFAAAAASIIVKEMLYRWTVRWGAKLKSSALVANAWHHRSDALSSIPPAIAIGAREIAGRFGHNLWYLDPLGAIIVCVMLLHAAWAVVAPSLQFLLDASADKKTCEQIEKIILDTPDVLGAHKIRSRYVGSNAVAVDMHLLVDGSLSVTEGHAIASRVKARLLASDLPTSDVVIHVEPAEEVDDNDD